MSTALREHREFGGGSENRGQHSSPTASAMLAYLFGRILQNHSHSDLRRDHRRSSLPWSNEACVQGETVTRTRTLYGHSGNSKEKRLPVGAPEAWYFVLLRLVAGVRNLPIAPTIRFEIPIVELAA